MHDIWEVKRTNSQLDTIRVVNRYSRMMTTDNINVSLTSNSRTVHCQCVTTGFPLC